MRLPAIFARRYLFSHKSHAVINIISVLSALAVGVPAAAMIILLSVFNGFESIVRSMYNDFDPDLSITAAAGKFFPADHALLEQIAGTDGVAAASAVLEENVLLEFNGRQFIGTLRGTDQQYGSVVSIGDMVSSGRYDDGRCSAQSALVGDGIAYSLGMYPSRQGPLNVIVPSRQRPGSLIPLDNFRYGSLDVTGTFGLDAETDGKYVITSLVFAQELLGLPGTISAVMVRIDGKQSQTRVRDQLQDILGADYKVLTRYQQKQSLYQIMRLEKWGIFIIIFFVMIIAAFSLVGSLVMLIIDKRGNMATLYAMGADTGLVRGIFVRLGMSIAGIGAVCGLGLGLILCSIQQRTGAITIPADTFLIDSYPVIIQPADILLVAAGVLAVSYVITKFTVSAMLPAKNNKR